jgi:hypothetical protein
MGTRCAYGDAQDLNLSGHLGEVLAVFAIIVTDQVDRVLAKRGGFT